MGRNTRGITLLEFIIVLAIIALLASIMFPLITRYRENAYFTRAKAEFRSMEEALILYRSDNGTLPDDVSRDLPPGLGKYLAGEDISNWPKAPWPGSVYDWDNWNDPANPGKKIYQISIRFCPIGGPLSACRFPNESWAGSFNINSAVYYCISGNCRAHASEPYNYPGYCVNCVTQPSG